MNDFLRDRILRRLETLSDERLYQVLDYVEFLESKYAQRQSATANPFQRFVEGVEDKLRAGGISAATVAETMSLMNRAMGVLGGVAAAGKSVASDIVSAANAAARPAPAAPVAPAAPAQSPPSSAPPASPSAGAPSAPAGSPTASAPSTPTPPSSGEQPQ
jgi:hypothetical protein